MTNDIMIKNNHETEEVCTSPLTVSPLERPKIESKSDRIDETMTANEKVPERSKENSSSDGATTTVRNYNDEECKHTARTTMYSMSSPNRSRTMSGGEKASTEEQEEGATTARSPARSSSKTCNTVIKAESNDVTGMVQNSEPTLSRARTMSDPILNEEEQASQGSRRAAEQCTTADISDESTVGLETTVEEELSSNNSTTSEQGTMTLSESHEAIKADNAISNEKVHNLRDDSWHSSSRDNDNPKRSLSFIKSLPVAQALPEFDKKQSIVTADVVTEVLTPVSHPLEAAATKNDKKDPSVPSLISVKVFKESRNTKLGIRFKTSSANGGTLVVDHVSPNGRLALSPIRAGDRLVSLDNHNCGNCWTPTMAVHYLKECVGFAYIVTTNASGDPKAAQATVYKSQPQDKLGIVLVNDEDNGKLRIKRLNAIGLLGSRSVLQVGDYVESINNVPCSEVDTALALNIIRSSENLVTIQVRSATTTKNNNTKPPTKTTTKTFESSLPGVTLTPTWTVSTLDQLPDDVPSVTATEILTMDTEYSIEPGFISVMAYKPNRETKLGIAFSKFDGLLCIARMTEDGLLAASPLKGGLRLLSINSRKCYDWDKKAALKYLRDAVGPIHLIAQNPKGNPEYVQAMVYKSSGSVGISCKGYAGRQLRICEVRPDGLFVNSVLNVGDDIIAINGIACYNQRPRDAVDIIKQATDTVTILARTQASSGVVVSRRP